MSPPKPGETHSFLAEVLGHNYTWAVRINHVAWPIVYVWIWISPYQGSQVWVSAWMSLNIRATDNEQDNFRPVLEWIRSGAPFNGMPLTIDDKRLVLLRLGIRQVLLKDREVVAAQTLQDRS